MNHPPPAGAHALPLRELQTRFMRALLGEPDAATPAARTVPAGTMAPRAAGTDSAPPLADALLIECSADSAAARLEVYRSNVRGNFLDALRSTFPVIARLVGDDYFRQTARHFQDRHPSRSGDLVHVGEHFAAYLAELHGSDRYRYLADVARFEWLIQEVLLCADHAPLDLGKLAAIRADDYDALRFELHPALRLFESPYPVQRIWEVNGGEAEPEPVDLDGGADCLALVQNRLQLYFHRLTPGELVFLRALGQGDRFAAAVDTATAHDGEFDAAASLQRWVVAGVIVDVHSQPD